MTLQHGTNRVHTASWRAYKPLDCAPFGHCERALWEVVVVLRLIRGQSIAEALRRPLGSSWLGWQAGNQWSRPITQDGVWISELSTNQRVTESDTAAINLSIWHLDLTHTRAYRYVRVLMKQMVIHREALKASAQANQHFKCTSPGDEEIYAKQ